MLKNINKPVIFFNVLTGLAFIYLLKNYNENTKHILNKLYSLKNWIVQYSCSFLKRYDSIQLPIIDKDIIIDLSNEELEEKFVQTCNAVKMYRNKLKTEEWLHLYGLFKQATIGNMILSNEEDSTKNTETSSNNNDTPSNNNDTSSYNNIENISNIDGKKKKKNKNNKNKNKNNKNNNKNNNNNMEFIEIQKRKAWKNCYNVNKNTCKYLYVQYFNKLFPDALEKLNNDDNMKFSKTVSKMKPFKEQNKKHLENDNNDDNNICDILCQHVVMGDLASIKKNLKHNPSLINKKNSSGLTPLHYACDRGYIDIVKYLVNQGAHINVEDSYGDTPLHMAAYSEKLNVVDFLQSVGADINKTNSEGLTIDWILSQN
ncbi:hypothetical protein PFDG_04255 [Plasmodium falciparum Dd2]|uniref:ACB domain-containing protein n=1 Tax=Plasmodium falciparum (isolate Dd2) TaxID=57267 RepID=A0A0L7M4S6_PLAF4|nr:hypothetical protein PFDG_04255 [Plasmodium falciparum Dd2]